MFFRKPFLMHSDLFLDANQGEVLDVQGWSDRNPKEE